VAAQPVPEVTVSKPAVSVPATLRVGVVQAAVPAVVVGVLPPVIMWPLTVKLPVVKAVTVTTALVVSTLKTVVDALAFWMRKAVVELVEFLKIVWPVDPIRACSRILPLALGRVRKLRAPA
jgi:hypothetical protein